MATQKQKIVNFLRSGKTLTENQAYWMFGIENVSARVAELRAEGVPVFTNRDAYGRAHYRLGGPTKEHTATAYALAGASAFL